MPREAKLFSSSSGSAVRGFLKFRTNIPPRWIKNARTSRKRVEPEVVRNLRTLKQLIKNRPHARVAIKDARKELKAVLQRLAREQVKSRIPSIGSKSTQA